MENNNVIRVAKNEIRVCGEVKEAKNLKIYEKEGKKSISGSLVVKTGEFQEVEVRLFVGELTKKGEVKKAYATLEKFMNGELKTLANADEENPVTKVDIFGNGAFTPHFTENLYVGQDGNVKSSIQVELGFGNIVVKEDLQEEDYCATFDVEVFIKNLKEEMNREGEETGRLILDTLVPMYGNVVAPISFVAGIVHDEEDGDINMAEALREGIEIGDTLELWGDIVNLAKVELVKKESKFGKARTIEKKEFVREYEIIGADEVAECNIFEEDEIREALANREVKIEGVKEKAESKEPAGKRKAGFGTKSEESGNTGKRRPRGF